MHPTLHFAGMAHIIRPKETIETFITRETQHARGQNPDAPVAVWRRPFEQDAQYEEAVVFYGQDLVKAGDTQQWTVEEALQNTRAIVKNEFSSVDPQVNGGRLVVGKTFTGEHAALYLYH